MKPGDLVKSLKMQYLPDGNQQPPGELGTFVGFATSSGYEYAEVIWFTRAGNGSKISSIQKNLIEVIK